MGGVGGEGGSGGGDGGGLLTSQSENRMLYNVMS